MNIFKSVIYLPNHILVFLYLPSANHISHNFALDEEMNWDADFDEKDFGR